MFLIAPAPRAQATFDRPLEVDIGLELKGETYVPSMHRKHSRNGRRRWIHGRNSSAVREQVQKAN